MALTRAQRQALSRRTTASSRARLRARYTGQQAFTPQPQPQLRAGITPVAPAAPRAPGVGASQRPAATPAVPPRATAQFVPDAQYLAEAAQRQFERQTRLDQLTAQAESDRTNTQEAIRQIMSAEPEQRQQVMQAARKQGLFYSGQLGKNLGDLESALVSQRANIQGQFDTNQRAREAARTAIMQGMPLDEAAARAAAVERQIGRDTEAANANRLVPTPMPRRAAPKPRRRRRKR